MYRFFTRFFFEGLLNVLPAEYFNWWWTRKQFFVKTETDSRRRKQNKNIDLRTLKFCVKFLTTYLDKWPLCDCLYLYFWLNEYTILEVHCVYISDGWKMEVWSSCLASRPEKWVNFSELLKQKNCLTLFCLAKLSYIPVTLCTHRMVFGLVSYFW